MTGRLRLTRAQSDLTARVYTVDRPAARARRDADEYEFTPDDPAKPVFYGFCGTRADAADFAEMCRCGMYRMVLPAAPDGG